MRDLCVCPEPEQVLHSTSPTAIVGGSSSHFEMYIGIIMVVTACAFAGCILIIMLYRYGCARKQEDELMDLDM